MSSVLTSDLEVSKRGGGGNQTSPPENSGVYFNDSSSDGDTGLPELPSDKKSDEQKETAPSGGYLWRLSSGVYNLTTGAVSGAASAGVNGAKWVADKSMTVGSTVYSKVPAVRLKRKDKNE